MGGYKLPYKSHMTADLFREGDVVAPTFGALVGVRGVVAHVGVYITIEFVRPMKKYPHDDLQKASHKWAYEPSNVRLISLARRRPSTKKV